MKKTVTLQALQRMPMYVSHLKTLAGTGRTNISAKTLADALGLVEIQVRKDLASVSGKGKPKIGYDIAGLIADIEIALGYRDGNKAVLVGAGRLGKALLAYEGFEEYGLNIIAAFDVNPAICGSDSCGKPIFSIAELDAFCKNENVKIGIITVPAHAAQEICGLLIGAGVKAIWNFAPIHLEAPGTVLVKNENMAASLALLSKHLTENS